MAKNRMRGQGSGRYLSEAEAESQGRIVKAQSKSNCQPITSLAFGIVLSWDYKGPYVLKGF